MALVFFSAPTINDGSTDMTTYGVPGVEGATTEKGELNFQSYR